MANEETPDLTRSDLEKIAEALDYEAAGLEATGEVEPRAEATAAQVEEVRSEGSVSPKDDAREVTQESQDQSQQAEEQADIDYRAEYERLRKEEERKDRSWKRLNEEKEALAKLKQSARPDETRIQGDQFSAEEYEQYAEKQVEEGNIADARRAMMRSKEIRQKAFQEKWQKSIQEAMDEEPELANPESDLAKAVQGILRDPTWGSFKTAVRLAKEAKTAGSIPGLKGELENYKKEIERLNKAMEIGGKAGVPKRESAKTFSEMSIQEQSAYLRQKATEADDAYYS